MSLCLKNVSNILFISFSCDVCGLVHLVIKLCPMTSTLAIEMGVLKWPNGQ